MYLTILKTSKEKKIKNRNIEEKWKNKSLIDHASGRESNPHLLNIPPQNGQI